MDFTAIMALVEKGLGIVEVLIQAEQSAEPAIKAVINVVTGAQTGQVTDEELEECENTLDQLIADFLWEIERILMPSGHMMMWVDKYILAGGCRLSWQSKFETVDFIIWNKLKIGMGYRSRRCSEFLVIYQKPPVRAKGVWQIHDIPDVWPERMDKSHPHAKPIGLMERLIRAVTNEGDIIVDPAAGGYNVLHATQKTSRRFIGCDISG